MSERDLFGPSLRRERLKKGVSLQSIARTTKISQDLLEGLEQNDFSRWPHGIFARAYVRSYALEVGADADSTVSDFCRWFPNGDRRVDRLVRGQASIIGHKSSWTDDLAAAGAPADRRLGSTAGPQPNPLTTPARKRLVASIVDSLIVIGASVGVSAFAHVSLMTCLAVSAVLYYGATLATLGCTPITWALDAYLDGRHPTARRARRPRSAHQVLSRSEH
jgi:transcriptional regulator with XRE-family HTH domain